MTFLAHLRRHEWIVIAGKADSSLDVGALLRP